MNRFFVSKDSIKGDMVRISGQDYNHISHSLRLQPGDKIIVCYGDGNDYLVKLTEFQNESEIVTGKIIEKKPNQNEPEVKITLAQAIPKNKNMELVAEKCTELGFQSLIPLTTKRTIVKLSGKKKQKRINRWQRIVNEAAKQSQRGIIPDVKDIHSIENISKMKQDYDLIIIFWTGENNNNLTDIFNNINKNDIENILIVIGPEGGFTKSEVNLIKNKADGYSTNLGPRILRTETAGLAALSIILYEFGEVGS